MKEKILAYRFYLVIIALMAFLINVTLVPLNLREFVFTGIIVVIFAYNLLCSLIRYYQEENSFHLLSAILQVIILVMYLSAYF